MRAKRMGRFGTVVLASILLACSGSATADQGPRTFSLVLHGNANPVPTENPCILVNTETGSGRSASLGEVRWESREVVDFCSNPEGADIDGEFVITSWNGDQIRGTYRTLGRADLEAQEIAAAGHYEITGGTGRFRRVSGKGAIAAAGSLASPFKFKGGLFGHW